jgi:hypothetical protein
MRFRIASTRGAVLLPLAALALSGCGKAGPHTATSSGGPLRKLAPVAAEGAVSVTTRNTTRVGGATAIDDAAAVARVVYPGLTAGSRPQAVVIANSRLWPATLAASLLSGAPLNAPILFAQGDSLPQVSREALEAMRPTGAATLGAQVIEIGTRAPVPKPYTVQAVPAGEPAAMAAQIEHLASLTQTRPPRRAIVVGPAGGRTAQMPAAGLAAESDSPILWAEGPALPAATADVLSALHTPSIYVVNGAGLSATTLGTLAKLGRVTKVPATSSGEAASPATAAIAAARFTDGTFGWGVKDPGHGLVFANAARPLDAPAAALLSATGEYGPLLLLETPGAIAPPLAAYLGDIQPAYTAAPEFQPVRGVYNHGWLIGDERAISLATQAELDSLLEISPRKQGGAEEATVLQAE